MKKFFSLVLALVMALSLTTVAWGADPVPVTTSEELQAAINRGDAEIVLGMGEFTADLYVVPANRNLTITGQGADTKLNFSKEQVRLALFDSLTISNCTIGRMVNKSWGQLVFGSSETAGGVYTLTKCIFDDEGTQGIYINQNVAATFNIVNCTFNGDFGAEGAIVFQNNSVPVTVNVSDNDFDVTNGEEIAIHYHKDQLILNADVDETVLIKAGDGGTAAENFERAVATADAGDTFKLMENLDLTTLSNPVEITDPINIDDNGQTLTGLAAGSNITTNANGEITGGTFTDPAAAEPYLADGLSVQPDGTVATTASFSGTVGTATFKENGTYYVLNGNVWEKVEYVAADEEDGEGNIAYFDGTQNYVLCKKSDAGAVMLTSGMEAGDKLLGYVKVAPVEYTMKGTKVAASAVVNCTTDFHAKGYKYVNPVTGVNEYYVDDASGAEFILIGTEVKQVSADTTAIIGGHVLKLNKTNALDALKTTYEYKCVRCGGVFKGVANKVAGVEYTKYDGASLNTDKLVAAYNAAGYNTTGYVDEVLYLVKTATPSAGTSTDKTVTSAETFDAGIAMYVGMSVMAAAGSAVVLKKKD